MKKIHLIIFIILLICPIYLNAADFDKNNIISDDEMTNFTSLTLNRIKDFLQLKGGVLANYITNDTSGTSKSAAEIIYDVSQKYLISPKFLLVTIQKESSLITSKTASQHLLDYALGYGCPDGGGCADKYKGFANQLDAAANKIMNDYWKDLESKNSTVSGWGVNITKQASDGTVTPENKATAVLYTYTPWIGYHGGNSSVGGNSLFWDIWGKYFGHSTEIVEYVEGSLLQSETSGIVYVIKNGKKMAFTSLGALMANYDYNKIITVDDKVLDQYSSGINILFPNYTLLQAPNGAMFLYVDGKKRGITSAEMFRNLGYNPEEAIPATWNELNNIKDGSLISENDFGEFLVQDKNTGALMFVDSKKKKHAIYAKEILETTFKGVPIVYKNSDEINQYKKGSPAKFRDGEIVTSPGSSSVYLIENGKKKAFKSKKVFDKLGYQWVNIINTTDDILDMHGKGKQVTLKKETAKKSSTKNKAKEKSSSSEAKTSKKSKK